MRTTSIALSIGLFLLPTMPARGEILKGVMAIKGAEMP